MDVLLKLKDFECFLADFQDIIVEDIDKVNKRRLILPWNLDLNVSQEILYKKIENSKFLQKVNIFKIKSILNKFEFKFADEDIDLLMGIMNYTLLLMKNQESEPDNKKEEMLTIKNGEGE